MICFRKTVTVTKQSDISFMLNIDVYLSKQEK